MKPKLVRVGRTYGLPNYSSVRIEWEVELELGEGLIPATEVLMQELEGFGKAKGWDKIWEKKEEPK